MDGYELVLQFRGPKVETEDEIVEIEDALFEVLELGESWTDMTSAPPRATSSSRHPTRKRRSRASRAFLARAGLIDDVVVGARPLAGTDFVTLWPPGDEPFDRA